VKSEVEDLGLGTVGSTINTVYGKREEHTRRKTVTESKHGIIIFVYYSGHGVLVGGSSNAVCIDADKEFETPKTVVDIDIMVGQLSAIPNTYVISLFDACREYSSIKLDRDLINDFGGENVRIYATTSGTRSVLDGGFELDENGNIRPIKNRGLIGFLKNANGTKITSKFVKHGRLYGYPDFPQGFSFWAWRTDVKQFQVEVVQNCTKTVHFIQTHEKDDIRVYQMRYLLSEKDVISLKERFYDLSGGRGSISIKELMKDLSFFGLNWPPERNLVEVVTDTGKLVGKMARKSALLTNAVEKVVRLEETEKVPVPTKLPKPIEIALKILFNQVQVSDDEGYLSIDEFFLLFMRAQPKIVKWNKILKEAGVPDRIKPSKNYIFGYLSLDELNDRFRVLPRLKIPRLNF